MAYPKSLNLFLAVSLLGAIATTTAQAVDFYGRFDGGLLTTDKNTGNLLAGSGFGNGFGKNAIMDAGIGLKLPFQGINLRSELTLSYVPILKQLDAAANSSGLIQISAQTRTRSFDAMANLLADIPTGTFVTPYIGGGVGLAANTLEDLSYWVNGQTNATETGASKTNFAWSAKAGLGMALSKSVDFDLGYRYLDAGSVQSSGRVKLLTNGQTITQSPLRGNFRAHQVTIGFRFGF